MASQASATASKADVARRFMQLREISPANSRCAECHAADTSWVVLDYGVLTCVHCAGCHRGLGTHISKVRSSQHDDFTPAEDVSFIEEAVMAVLRSAYGELDVTIDVEDEDDGDAEDEDEDEEGEGEQGGGEGGEGGA